MTLEPDAAYRVLQSHDARFDGRLFVGVTSTGIYCRPVCRVRLPRRENCRFFANAASAEQGGFRPCLRCRPELAPGLSLVDSPQGLAQHAARMLEYAARHGQPVQLPAIAAKLGVTDRHLRRIFAAWHGVTPIDYLTNQRLLLAKQLLTDTALSVADVAAACGFESQRRFNAVFSERCRLSPSGLRRAQPRALARRRGGTPLLRLPDALACDALKVRLAYRPPYDIAGVQRFLAARCIAGVEAMDDQGLWRRTLAASQGAAPGWLALQFLPERHEVEVMMSPSLAPQLGRINALVRHALDLDADPALIDPVLAALPWPRFTAVPGIRVPGGCDGFESAVRVILGQQVTVAAARTLTRRLVERFGETVETPWPELNRLFPSARTLAQAPASAIGELGIVRQRVGALQALAAEVHHGRIALDRGAPLAATLDALRALPGIGEWSVQLIAMRALAWPDAFPASDIGVMNALGTRDAKAVAAMSENWRPWRSYAVMRLWQSLETGT
ncbi:Ada metal-binding domain-containing protein [Methylibium sp.]|uniref:Ada metal-binding domain-containing protein n=1 Tax=Methylibium sp. TaxID=2067992 RepID=UPI00286AD875|nr:Ada metal-binding domain-containing protein [Methylibium sp.]